MLTLAHGLTIAKSYELTQAQAQALVDLEAQCADLGLQMYLNCRVCHAASDDPKCTGDAKSHDDGTMTFSVDCGCSKRAFRGVLRAPMPPRALRRPRLDLTVKPEVVLSRQQMRVFQDAESALFQLRIRHSFRCLACRQEDRLSDGVWGSAESNASQFVVECACTRRIYKGADVKLA